MAGAELKASSDPELDVLLRTEYRQPADRRQTDIFFDSAETRVANDLADALAIGAAAAAREHIERLRRLDGQHWMLPLAAVLIEALKTAEPNGRETALARMETLERRWLPAASAVLRASARDFATPVWRAIATALDDGAAFDPAFPNRHASFAYFKGLDWANVRRSVRAVPGFADQPALLERLAEAEWRLRNPREARRLWFVLCWRAPACFANAVSAPGFPDNRVRQDWECMQHEDWETEATADWLPAWMVAEDDAMARAGRPSSGGSPPEQAYDLILELKAGLSDRQDSEHRRALQQLRPALLHRYIAGLDD